MQHIPPASPRKPVSFARMVAIVVMSFVPAPCRAQTTVVVPGTAGHKWVDTKLDVRGDTYILIRAFGEVEIGGGFGRQSPMGTTGYANVPGYPADTPFRYGLAVRLTSSRIDPQDDLRESWSYGEMAAQGDARGRCVRSPGHLWLTVNDNAAADNRGEFKAEISLSPCSSSSFKLDVKPRTLRLSLVPNPPAAYVDIFAVPRVNHDIAVRVSTRGTRVRVNTPNVVIPASTGVARVSVTPLAVGEPEVPADTVQFSATGAVTYTPAVDVWIEPPGGQWRSRRPDGQPMEWDIVAVHAALMRRGQTGSVLIFSPPRKRAPGGGFVRRNGAFQWELGALRDVEIKTVDPVTFIARDSPMQASGLQPVNLFCTGHAHTADGRLMTAGGHISWDSIGDPNAAWLHFFDASGRGPVWSRLAARMRHHRWYPTVTTLPDGNMLITSGSSQAMVSADHYNHMPVVGFYAHIEDNYEIFDPRAGAFRAFEPRDPPLTGLNAPAQAGVGRVGDPGGNPLATYPAVFVLPGGAGQRDGTLFMQEANRGWLYQYAPLQRAPLVRAGTIYRMVATRGSRSYPHYGSAVLLPFTDGARRISILALGGQDENESNHKRLRDDAPTTATAEIFDYNLDLQLDRQTGWRGIAPMRNRRIMPDATLLADGTVLVTGGVTRGWANHSRARDAVLEAEIFDPATQGFRSAASAAFDRRYHATALLLPDGSLLKMGSTGGFDDAVDPDGLSWIQPHFNGERFLPGYMFRGPRPRIAGVDGPVGTDDTIQFGRPFQLRVEGEDLDNLRIAIVRLGSVTHGLNMAQRFVYLRVTGQRVNAGGRTVDLLAPSSGAVAPPGDYMMFVIDRYGVPSRARFVRFSG